MTRTFDRSGTGTGRGKRYVVNARKDMPKGVPAPAPAPAPSAAEAPSGEERVRGRDVNGRIADPRLAADMGQRSARVRAEKKALVGAWTPRKLRLGGHQLFEVRSALERFATEADAAFNAKCEEIARDVGGGYCGVGVRACIRQWAHAHYGALAMFEMAMGPLMFDPKVKDAPKIQAEIYATATRMASEARGSLLCAHSLASAEATSRSARVDAGADVPWLLQPAPTENK